MHGLRPGSRDLEVGGFVALSISVSDEDQDNGWISEQLLNVYILNPLHQIIDLSRAGCGVPALEWDKCDFRKASGPLNLSIELIFLLLRQVAH